MHVHPPTKYPVEAASTPKPTSTMTEPTDRHLQRESACDGLVVDWPSPKTTTNDSDIDALPDSRPTTIFDRNQRHDVNNHDVDGPAGVQQKLASMTMARAEQSEPVSITQKKQRRGSITFSREVRVKVIPSLSDDAAERIWYTEDEYAALGKECVLVAKEMRRLYRREG